MPMLHNKTVTYRSGRAHYTAIHTGRAEGGTWQFQYTLIPLKGGTKRHLVEENDLHEVLNIKGAEVQTSVGKVKVPDFRRYRTASGGTRRTYLGPKWVFKRPLGDWGHNRNEVEAARWALTQGESIDHFSEKAQDEVRRYYQDVPVAECYLLADGTLMMERVRTIYNIAGKNDVSRDERPAYPDWVCRVDSDQIGFNRHNEIVAYDL